MQNNQHTHYKINVINHHITTVISTSKTLRKLNKEKKNLLENDLVLFF